ncbi:VOC family protein [Chitinophaga lutea]
MELIAPIPALTTPSMKETVDFYVSVLEFTCNAHDDQWRFASIHKDDVTLELVHPQAPLPYHSELFTEPVFTGAICIHTEQVDEFWEKVKDKAEVCFPVQDFDYGMREFGIYDNNGYLLQFCRPIGA